MRCRTQCPTTSSAVFGAGNHTGAPTPFPLPNPLSREHFPCKRDRGCLWRQGLSTPASILPRKHPSSCEGDKEGFLQGCIFLCVPIPPLLPVACLLSSSPFPSTELRKRALPSAFPSPFSARTPPAPFEIPPRPREVTDEYGVANARVVRKHLNKVIRTGGDELPCRREDREPARRLAAVSGTQGSCSRRCFCWHLLQRHRRVSMRLTRSSRAARRCMCASVR